MSLLLATRVAIIGVVLHAAFRLFNTAWLALQTKLPLISVVRMFADVALLDGALLVFLIVLAMKLSRGGGLSA